MHIGAALNGVGIGKGAAGFLTHPGTVALLSFPKLDPTPFRTSLRLFQTYVPITD